MKCPHCKTELSLVVSKAGGSAPAADSSDLEGLLREAESLFLNEWEQGFINDLSERFSKWGSRTKVSDKQMATLRKIVETNRA